jgi:hypothetical protein
MFELLLRLVVSMAVVMAVMALAARFLRRRQGGVPRSAAYRAGKRAGGPRPAGGGVGAALSSMWGARQRNPRQAPPLEVLHRQMVAKGAWVILVEVGGRRLLLGATEHAVNLVAEVDEPPPDADRELTGTVPANLRDLGFGPGDFTAEGFTGTGRMPEPLEGAETGRQETAWKLALDSLRERTVRH